ncbi:MAG: hypothetical protein LBD85_01480 [Oscillospiraceae bacterium]|nr:hypothetical protein [Oscillospiraceae bacterium]
MSKYRLNITFGDNALDIIHAAKQRVVIVKHTAERKSMVAWVSFKPFERNTIDWENDFALYASTGETQSGATITKLSDCEGQCRTNAIFNKGYFSSIVPDSTIGANSYEATNKDFDVTALTFGLAQSVSVNGTAFDNHPINAILVPRGHNAVMTPVERIDVFLEAEIDSSTILSRIDSRSLALTYADGTDELSIAYNTEIGEFYELKA